jgi:predicted nucleic acid-binding protein
MLLVVDASILIEYGLRVQGRQLLQHKSLELSVATETWAETVHERRKRIVLLVERGNLTPASAAQLADETAVIDADLTIAPISTYVDHLDEAAWRIPRDPRDVFTVALGLSLGCGIWTGDRDFFGCGLPVWSTDVLRRHLEHAKQQIGSDDVSA